MNLLKIKYLLIAVFISTTKPVEAMEQGSSNLFGRISEGFTADRFPIQNLLIYIAVFGLVLIGLYGIFWIISQSTKPSKKKVTILQALKENYQLSASQNRYLEALIEKFKNRHPYEPEISTDYLEKFLEYTVQNLTHAPDQTLRRQVHHVPSLTTGEALQVMFKHDEQFKTQRCKIIDQKDKYITVKKPENELILEQKQSVEVTYREEDLHYRGEGEIRSIGDTEIIIFLPQGLRFEEKRVFYRLPLNSLPARITLQGPKNNTAYLEGTLEDISAEGACIFVEEQDDFNLKKHLRGTLEFDLPGFRTVDIRCEVVRVKEQTETVELGLKFIQLSVVVKENIINYIHKRQRGSQQSGSGKSSSSQK